MDSFCRYSRIVNLESRPGKPEHVLARRTEDSLVVLNPQSGQYYALDDVGARVWELCDGRRSVSELVAILCGEYDAAAATVQEDVLELLADLAEEDLVQE